MSGVEGEKEGRRREKEGEGGKGIRMGERRGKEEQSESKEE